MYPEILLIANVLRHEICAAVVYYLCNFVSL